MLPAINAVHIENISKDYYVDGTPQRVLHHVSASISMGEMTMLVGPSGSGKTTLISIISGVLSASEGTVQLLDRPYNTLPDEEKVLFRRNHLGFIFQQYNLLPALTAAENTAMTLMAQGVKNVRALARARAMLEKVGLGEHTEKMPRQLSGGQQQRVAIARALVHKPEIIICDEPTAALDAKAGQSVMKILRDAADSPDRAVIVVTHDSRIYHFADRILQMSDGRLIGDHLPADFIEKSLRE